MLASPRNISHKTHHSPPGVFPHVMHSMHSFQLQLRCYLYRWWHAAGQYAETSTLSPVYNTPPQRTYTASPPHTKQRIYLAKIPYQPSNPDKNTHRGIFLHSRVPVEVVALVTCEAPSGARIVVAAYGARKCVGSGHGANFVWYSGMASRVVVGAATFLSCLYHEFPTLLINPAKGW